MEDINNQINKLEEEISSFQVKTIKLNEANGWKGEFDNLPTKENGNPINYTVEETAVPTGYTKAITGTASTGFTITNTHTPETTKVPVTKVWNDNNKDIKEKVIELTKYFKCS